MIIGDGLGDLFRGPVADEDGSAAAFDDDLLAKRDATAVHPDRESARVSAEDSPGR